VRAGISPVTEDFGHTPQAVRLARTSLAASDEGHVTFFSDSPITTMAAGAPDVASELSAVVLYRVLELPEPDKEMILETVRTWFSTGGSVADTARSMFVHPNTVRNRLRRLESLTLRSLSDPRHAAELYLAVVSLPRRTPD
jgi:DNA-binding PucR family transcriptional regulator